MDRTRTAGVALTGAGVAGYLAGLATPYPGRAFSVTAVTVGITLASIGDSGRSDDGDDGEEGDRAAETSGEQPEVAGS
jgi:hypothetical protein